MTVLDTPRLPDDLYITGELRTRATKAADYLMEKRAIQELAARMVDAPGDVLPHFVQLAMEMADGVSAGLSLYEENPAPGIFRWRYLRGVLSPFENATTPRNFSPCGITLDQNSPVLSNHPERFYDWISNANIVVPEVLLVPLYIEGAEPLGTLWIVAEKEGHFDGNHARAMTELASFLGIALRMLRTEERLQRALEEQETLTREMSHRIKNLFAMSDGMIRVSAKDAASKEEMANILSGRMHALAAAHSLVRSSMRDVGKAPATSGLAMLLKTIVAPHDALAGNASRFLIEGPEVKCSEQGWNGIALIFHELVTNAAKHGALTDRAGRVDIRWSEQDGKLVLVWTEKGGPAIAAPPSSAGFGSALMQLTINRQFKGNAVHDWRHEGLSVTITLPLESLSA